MLQRDAARAWALEKESLLEDVAAAEQRAAWDRARVLEKEALFEDAAAREQNASAQAVRMERRARRAESGREEAELRTKRWAINTAEARRRQSLATGVYAWWGQARGARLSREAAQHLDGVQRQRLGEAEEEAKEARGEAARLMAVLEETEDRTRRATEELRAERELRRAMQWGQPGGGGLAWPSAWGAEEKLRTSPSVLIPGNTVQARLLKQKPAGDSSVRAILDNSPRQGARPTEDPASLPRVGTYPVPTKDTAKAPRVGLVKSRSAEAPRNRPYAPEGGPDGMGIFLLPTIDPSGKKGPRRVSR